MIHGLYLAAHGAGMHSIRQDVIANNLANASTTGFRRDMAVFRVYDAEALLGNIPVRMQGERQNELGAGGVAEVVTVHQTASHQKSSRPLDVALAGDGFLRVSNGEQEFLTRNGRMRRNEFGELVTEDDGLKVLSTAGVPLAIPADAVEIMIGQDGTIDVVNLEGAISRPGRLDVVTTQHDQLEKLGGGLYRAGSELEPALDVTVRQGFTEASGVNAVSEMAAMIETSRAFETSVNMIRIQDESLGRLLQGVTG